MKRLSGLGRGTAVFRDAHRAHAHPQAGGHRTRRPRGPHVRHRRVPRGHPRPALQTRPVPLSARRHPVQVPPPDVAGELRGRPRLPRPAVPRRQPRRPPPTGRGGRQDRQHAAGPQQAAVGDVLHRGSGQRPDRGARQDPPRAGRRRGVGQPAGAGDGSADRAAARPGFLRDRPRAEHGRAGALGVRRPHAPDRPAARRDALHRAGHRPGAQEHQEAVTRADAAVHPAAVVHEPPRRRATQVRHRDAGPRRRQGDGQSTSASRSTTWCWRSPRARCASCR